MAIALYARKSIEKENSISCETQLEYCKAMLKPDERGEKVLTFVDNGFSGGNVNREGFQKMMRKVEQGKITKVVVYMPNPSNGTDYWEEIALAKDVKAE